MPTFVDSLVSEGPGSPNYSAGSTNYIIQTDAGVIYRVFITQTTNISFTKSVDGGKTWAAPTNVYTGTTVTKLSVWFDKWSGLAGGLIHCAYEDDGGADDVLYRSINTASADALGTQTTIWAGASGTTGLGFSITRTRGGNLLCCGTIDNGTENFARKSTDVGANWADIAAVMEAAADDQIIMAPGFAADNQDAMCLFWDASADEISVKFYDDSGDSWSETSIATSMVELAPGTAYPNWSIAVDLTNTNVLLAAWTQADLANADLRIWTVDEAAQTELTNVVLNSTDDQGLCAVSLDTISGDITVFYGGASAGGQTWNTSLSVFYKTSTDDGATWGSETRCSAQLGTLGLLLTNPRQVYLSGELQISSQWGPSGLRSIVHTSIEPTLPTEAQVQSGVDYGINGVEFEGTYAGGGSGGGLRLAGSGGLAA